MGKGTDIHGDAEINGTVSIPYGKWNPGCHYDCKREGYVRFNTLWEMEPCMDMWSLILPKVSIPYGKWNLKRKIASIK